MTGGCLHSNGYSGWIKLGESLHLSFKDSALLNNLILFLVSKSQENEKGIRNYKKSEVNCFLEFSFVDYAAEFGVSSVYLLCICFRISSQLCHLTSRE